MRYLVFAGTTEARKWINHAQRYSFEQWVFVTTSYAKELLPQEGKKLKIFVGKKDKEELRNYFKEDVAGIIDASHPFAELLSENLRELAKEYHLPYYRLLREETALQGVHVVESYQDAVDYLETTKGNILLTTGAKTLEIFVTPKLHLRIYARILPMVEGLQKAIDLGLGYKQILALQGPFTKDMNLAMLDQYNIDIMVTKESGRQGGVEEKALAAREAGIELVVIKRPVEQGYHFEELVSKIEAL